ncbi:MAG: hypothetical protein ACMG55_02410 [Microcoleus sp.]
MVTFIHKERLNGTEVPRLACIERTEVAEFSASRISSYKGSQFPDATIPQIVQLRAPIA